MTTPSGAGWKHSGLRRLTGAARHQMDGVRHGLLHDPAIRQVSLGCLALCVGAAVLPVSPIEQLLLVLSTLLVLLVEILNSAIEAAVDRISLDPHPLSKIAKDLGSVAVGLAVLMCALAWLVIAGPLLLRGAAE